ncbi:hypothetical protein JMJ35_001584 [Cladonia borealis]|uniref:ubiquitinyl hydrolase 1 n=1 Tax=Cladonia borealis TaxID=184061 RepID=A0AA39V9H3_9LECA|nr:hypothetical protein JMJ35_001584 [Cladonia borealis]
MTSEGEPRIKPDDIILPPNHPSLTPAKLMKQPAQGPNSARNAGGPPPAPKPEDKEHPDYKKRVAQARGPTISMTYDNTAAYGMPESLFTSLKDIFEALLAHKSNVGVVSPNKFLDVLKRENEMFRSAMHQDAHEFLNLLLNEVVANVEAHSKKLNDEEEKRKIANGSANGSADETGFEQALASAMPKTSPGNTGWVHELFEGTLTSETKCLTCENVSQRDEAFLDLSVDLDEHSSVTACLHDAEDPDRLYELYAVVVHIGGGPYHGHYISIVKTQDRGWLLFDDEMVEPVDKSYVQNFFGDRPGLACAYVLFYQETTLEAVKREQEAESLASAAKAAAEVHKEPVGLGLKTNGFLNGITHVKSAVTPTSDDTNGFHGIDTALDKALGKAITEPSPVVELIDSPSEVTALPQIPTSAKPNEEAKSKKELAKEEKDRKAIARISARAEEKAEKERRKNLEIKRKEMVKKADADTRAAIEASKASKAEEDQKLVTDNGIKDSPTTPSGGLSRFKATGKSFRKPKIFSREATKEEPTIDADGEAEPSTAGETTEKPTEKSKHRFSSLRKKSSNMKIL